MIVKYLQVIGEKNTRQYRLLKEALRDDLPVIRKHPGWDFRKKLKVMLVISGGYLTVRNIYYRMKNI